MRWRQTAAAVIVFFAITVTLQRASGAYEVEFSGGTDEGGQVVTSLMLRDYLMQGFPEKPLPFAEHYYVHYPKIVLGMWPPLFHCLLGLWTTISASRAWILLFQALLGTALATGTYLIIKTELSASMAFLGGLVFCVSPLTLVAERIVMPDILYAVLACGCMLTFARFLEYGRRADIIAFGVLAGLALATKGNAISLAFVPPLTVIFLRRWDLIRNSGVWISAAIAGALGLPWQILMVRLQSGTVPYAELTLAAMLRNVLAYPALFWSFAGPVQALAALVGILWAIVTVVRGRASSMTAVQLAMLLAFYCTHCVVTLMGPEPRYFMQALPPLIFFAMGCSYPALRLKIRLAPALAILAMTAAGAFLPLQKKESYGMKEAVDFLLSQPGIKGNATLVSAGAVGESSFIGEFVIDDSRRPSYWVLRGSKSLSSSNWYGEDYKLLFNSCDEIRAYLKSIPVRYLVIDDADFERLALTPHQALLEQMVRDHPGEWPEIGRFPRHQTANAAAGSIKIYRLAGGGDRRPTGITVDLGRTLGHAVSEN